MRLMDYIFPATVVAVFAIFGSAIYGARLSYHGYCFSQGRYVPESEKVRIAVARLLETYPPAATNVPLGSNWWQPIPPNKPIHYLDVDEFLAINHDCCKVVPIEKYIEGGHLTLLERVTGTATQVVEIRYLVRHRDDINKPQSFPTKANLQITNCADPGKPWSPY